MGGGASKKKNKTQKIDNGNSIMAKKERDTNTDATSTTNTTTNKSNNNNNNSDPINQQIKIVKPVPKNIKREESEAMVREAQKALQHMDSLSNERMKTVAATEKQDTWETQMEEDARNQTEEGRACITIQKLVRKRGAEKILIQKTTWRNRNQLELFFERHATKYTNFYENVYSKRIEKHNLCMDRNVTTMKTTFPFPNKKNSKLQYSSNNIDVVLQSFRKTTEANSYLELDDFLTIIEAYNNIIKLEETLISLPKKKSNIPLFVIVGDLHGHFEDLMEIIDDNGVPTKNKPYIFTGNIINYGPKSIYCLTMIMLWSIAEPESVYFLRGNHEHASYSLKFGFVHEICSIYIPTTENQATLHKLFVSLHELFHFLPLCIQLYEKCLICHSGIWRDERIDLESVKNIKRGNEANVGNLFQKIGVSVDLMQMTEEERNHCIVQDILWSDLYDKSANISFNEDRGISILYDTQHVQRVLENCNLNTLIISGSPLQDGYKDDVAHCIRVFSASSYFGNKSNLGGYLLVEKNELQIHPCSFSVKGGKRDKHYHYCKYHLVLEIINYTLYNDQIF